MTNFRKWTVPLIQFAILLVFALTPTWFRLPPSLHPLYAGRFVMLWIVVGIVLLWIVSAAPGLRELGRDRLRGGWALALLGLALWAFASQGWAFMRVLHPEEAATSMLQLCAAALFALVVVCVPPRPQHIALALAFGVLWNAPLMIAQVYNGGALGLSRLGEFPYRIGDEGVSVIVSGDWRLMRPYGLLPHPNILAGVLMAAWCAAVGGLFAARRGIWFWIVVLGVGTWGLLLSFSRAAWLGAAAGGVALLPLLILPLFLKRQNVGANLIPAPTKRVIIGAAVVLVIGMIFAAVYFPLILARGGVGLENTELRSISDRTVFTGFALEAISESPLLGVGIGNFPWRSSYFLAQTNFDLRGDNVHHLYLSAWAELGIIGFMLLCAAQCLGVEAALRQFKHDDPAARAWRAGLLSAVVALTTAGLFDHYVWTLFPQQILFWGLLAGATTRE
jgi:O-antigen ligase